MAQLVDVEYPLCPQGHCRYPDLGENVVIHLLPIFSPSALISLCWDTVTQAPSPPACDV